MIRLTRRYKFSAAHRLHSPELSAAANSEIYGKCNHPHGHGHDYLLDVSVRGPVDPRTGLVVDVRTLDRLVDSQIISRLGHRNLNREVDELAGLSPTTEHLARAVSDILLHNWRGFFPAGVPRLDRVRIHETKRNIFEVAPVQ